MINDSESCKVGDSSHIKARQTCGKFEFSLVNPETNQVDSDSQCERKISLIRPRPRKAGSNAIDLPHDIPIPCFERLCHASSEVVGAENMNLMDHKIDCFPWSQKRNPSAGVSMNPDGATSLMYTVQGSSFIHEKIKDIRPIDHIARRFGDFDSFNDTAESPYALVFKPVHSDVDIFADVTCSTAMCADEEMPN